jgi:hypothetical protein
MYADGQHALPIIVYNVTWSNRYDNKDGDTKHVACSNLAHRYPHFKDFPHFPYIGGASFIHRGIPGNCGSCWNLTDLKAPHKTISVTVIDTTTQPGARYNISKEAFNVLNGGKLGSKWLQAEARLVSPHPCHKK